MDIFQEEKIMSLNLENRCKSNMKGYARNKKQTDMFGGKRRVKLPNKIFLIKW